MKWHTAAVCLSAAIVFVNAGVVPEETNRVKRSGSGDIVGLIGSAISSKIQSIAAASGSLSASSNHHPPPETKQFTFWEYKKALLNTLLQAVKAIKGGIIILKGHIIKAKGNLLGAKARLVSSKGEQISNLGKHIASSALGLDGSHSAPAHHPGSAPSAGYASGPSISSGYGGVFSTASAYGGPPPAPPSTSYGVPTGPNSFYGAPFNHARDSRSTALPDGVKAGLLVIKPITPNKPHYVPSVHHDIVWEPSELTASYAETPFNRPFAFDSSQMPH